MTSPVFLLPDDGSSLIVSFDLLISEGHEMSSEVTSHPVEKGVNVADHVRKLPRVLSLELFISNAPLTDLGRGGIETFPLVIPQFDPPIEPTPGSVFRQARKAVGALIGEVLGAPLPIKISVLAFSEPFNRIKETHQVLQDLWDKAIPMTVITTLLQYDTMVLEKVSVPIDEPGGAKFSLELKQLHTVTSATVQAPKPQEPRGAPKVDKGGQTPAPPAGGAKAVSLGQKALNAVKDLGIF